MIPTDHALRPSRGIHVAALGWLLVAGAAASAGDGVDLFVPLDPPCATYTIEGSVRLAEGSAVVSGVERIVLTNSTPRPLTLLALEWADDDRHSLELTAGGRPAKTVSPAPGSDEGSAFIVALPEAVGPGENLVLDARFEQTYTLEPDETKHLWTSWFPRIDWGVPAQDDFVVRLDLPEGYAFASSGRYDPALDAWRADGVRRYGLFLMKDASVLEDEVDGVAVRVVHSAAGTDCARLILETARDAVGFYVDRFGFFPSDHIDIVPGAEQPMGGYPPATSLVVIHGMERMSERDEQHWRWITAHELGHQYWFEHVMASSRGQMGWLMIGLGIHVDREFMRARDYGPEKHRELMDRYLAGVREGLDTRADVEDGYLDAIPFDFNNVVIHGKGYSIISALDCLLGRDLFDRIHGRCLREFAGRRLTFPDFQAVCEQESGQDLDWFFDQWVRSSPYLSYGIVSQECEPGDGGYRTTLRVAREGTLDMPVPVTARFADGTEQTAFTGRLQAVSVVRFDSAAPLTDAVIDADGELAMVVPPPDPEELEVRRKLSEIPAAADIAALPDLVERALAMDIPQTLFWGQLGRKLYDWKLYDEALAVFDRRAGLLRDMQSEWVMSACGWRGLLLDLLDRRDEAVAAYREALAVEADREFSYDGDPVTISRAWLRERLETPFERPER